MKTFLFLLLKIFLILLLVFLLLASIPVPILILPTVVLYGLIILLWIMNKKAKNFTTESYDQAHGSLFATYGVNYLCGLPEKKNVIFYIPMFLTAQGFLFKSSKFNLFIDYSKVKSFELIKGTGSSRGFNPIWDIIKAKLFQVTYFDDNNQKTCVRFEMHVSSFYAGKNYIVCEELVRVMKNNGIFDKFIPTDSTTTSVPSADILA